MTSTLRTLQAGYVLLKTKASITPSKKSQHSLMSHREETLEKKIAYWALSTFTILLPFVSVNTRFTQHIPHGTPGWPVINCCLVRLSGHPSPTPECVMAEKESPLQGRHLCRWPTA